MEKWTRLYLELRLAHKEAIIFTFCLKENHEKKIKISLYLKI